MLDSKRNKFDEDDFINGIKELKLVGPKLKDYTPADAVKYRNQVTPELHTFLTKYGSCMIYDLERMKYHKEKLPYLHIFHPKDWKTVTVKGVKLTIYGKVEDDYMAGVKLVFTPSGKFAAISDEEPGYFSCECDGFRDFLEQALHDDTIFNWFEIEIKN